MDVEEIKIKPALIVLVIQSLKTKQFNITDLKNRTFVDI